MSELRFTSIVFVNPSLKVMTVTDIQAFVFLTLKNVNVVKQRRDVQFSLKIYASAA